MRRMKRTGRWYMLRVELGIGVVALAWLLQLWLFPQVFMGGPGPAQGVTFGAAVHLAGIAVVALGVVWMWRIMHANPEAGAPTWHYHHKR
jgi:hypothetical protein